MTSSAAVPSSIPVEPGVLHELAIARAGKAIIRYEDKDDGSEYFYTLFVPMVRAETPQDLGKVKDLLAGKLAIPGMTLKPPDRWNLVGHLIAMGAASCMGFVTE